MHRDKRIDAYIASLPEWHRGVCRRIRSLIHAAEPEIEETIKFTDRPYFVLQGNVCALLAAKDHVNVFIYDPVAPDPQGIITQGLANKTARAIQIYPDTRTDYSAFKNLIRAVATNNRHGGWRKLKK